MKKALAVFLALALLLTLGSCGGGSKKKAFTLGKNAFDEIEAAYCITEQFASDIYAAWREGIYSDDELLKDGEKYLAKKLSISEEYIQNAIAYEFMTAIDLDWDIATEEEKEEYRGYATDAFTLFEDELFTFCTVIVKDAYMLNGKSEEIQEHLGKAKEMLKEMSEKYEDYEHYSSLKKYFNTTNTLFEFCKEPSGNFNQMSETINRYKNDAREYRSDLYLFAE